MAIGTTRSVPAVVLIVAEHLPAVKQSGIGVEWGEEGIREYTRVQVVNAAKQ